MAVSLNKLTDGFVKSAGPGDYGDGGRLVLAVTPTLSRSWIFRYRWRGKTNRIGLGPTHVVSLKEAPPRPPSAAACWPTVSTPAKPARPTFRPSARPSPST